MLDHLVEFEPEVCLAEGAQSLEGATPAEVLDAQVSTATWLEQLGVPSKEEVNQPAQASIAQSAFTALTTNKPAASQKEALLALKTPPAVRHLVSMLTAYDWAFVEQAKELRGYAVSQILEETKHPDARIRLRALDMLGRVTEVALFTDRMEIKKTELSDKEIDEKIKEKLNRFMGVVDATPVDVETKAQAPDEAA